MYDFSKDPAISIVRANQPLIKVSFLPVYPVSYPRTATSLIFYFHTRCTEMTFNISHSAGLSAPYVREFVSGHYKFKSPP